MSIIPFDDRDGVIWYNGELIDWRDANFHVLSHALHYGSCVFEGQRAYGGKIFKLHEHSERLIKSGEILGMDIPYTADELDAAADEVVAANNLVDAYVRPVAWRGSEMMGVATKGSKVHVAIAAWEWPSYFGEEAKKKGLRLEIAKWRRPAPDTAPTASKAAGLYMIASLCKDASTENGFDDALMLDYRGQVAEATGANIFFLKDGKLHTPTPDCFLDGITRRTAIDLATKRGIEVIERAIMPEEMADFEQAFITGTAAEITPLSQIADYTFEVGEVCMNMVRDYDDLVNGRQT
ncbi:branched-chain amino acid aminotransferase [Pseudemcibacter aquimaris]|uniref:branched-chain amino acid aminotransferase n=1 Tax=Pseudemcibacter aquimaris TaxID=2857064 RepID=UPI002013469C|nr:branched-chain amino acid aminotransferase [Pseudemcibacter aquimaris]MCC3861011.1 branched-chain amino acid aminotransferase [Pseudemcibacter aquimaris]WDU59829.1 branched-chain amino acid aminotransferase [Pseudemcibacter aquimaris]